MRNMVRMAGLVFVAFQMVLLTACASSSHKSNSDTSVNTDNGPGDTVGQDTRDASDQGMDLGHGDIGPADHGVDACTCSGKNYCCDGCKPINEGAACGDFGACKTKGTCQKGVCVGGGEEKACNDPGPCQVNKGKCNPDTGKCEYPAVPDGQPCQAKPGIDGSGICQSGKCFGFGACDHSAYGQPMDYPCNFNSECKSGWCKPLDDLWTKFCTRECGPDMPPCPKGMYCVNGGPDTGRYCRPVNRDAIGPKDRSQGLFAPCHSDADCKGGLCLALDGVLFCSANCESGDHKADDKLCGACGHCRDNGDKLKFKFKYYCTPAGSRRLGEPCRWSGDCLHRFCMDGLCSNQCLDFNGKSNCPDSMQCVSGVVNDPTIKVCVPKNSLDKGLGDECEGDYSCSKGLKCIKIGTKKICTADCSAEGSTCAEGVCTQYASHKKACLPQSWVGTKAEGDACTTGFQCQQGLTCIRGACLRLCDKDEDCNGKECFIDLWYQAGYCVDKCDTDKDCPDTMTCFDGQCVMSANHGVFVNGFCRTDKDCVTGMCKGSLCVAQCSDSSQCEGSTPIQPGGLSLCKPCDPNKFGMDCKDDYGFNDCVQDVEGHYFCAPMCDLTGPGVCPVGTRCYSMNGISVCAPLSGACDMQTACNSKGLCTKPQPPSLPCEEDADCGNGKCKNGRCDGPDCTEDADCKCPLRACVDGRCVTAPDAGLAEREPNNTPATAQALNYATKPQMVVASLYSQDQPDKDYFSITLKAGDMMDVWTEPFCRQFADTKLLLLDKDGNPIKDWVSDNITPKYPFSLLQGFKSQAGQKVIIAVMQGEYTLGVERLNYMLGVNIFRPVQNDTCAQAVTLDLDGQAHQYDLAKATNTMSAPSCTGTDAPGKDMAFNVSIPANTYVIMDAQTPFDSQLYLLKSCDEPDKNCVAGVDNYWRPAPEKLLYANHGSEAQDLVLVVDSFLPMRDMTFTLSGKPRAINPAVNDTVATATPIARGNSTITGDTIGAANDYDTGKTSCVGSALPGRDVVYSVELQPNDVLDVTLKDFAGVYPVLLLTKDPTDPKGCLAVKQGSLSYQNKESSAQKAFLVIDSVIKDGYSTFTLDVKLGPGTRGPAQPHANKSFLPRATPPHPAFRFSKSLKPKI